MNRCPLIKWEIKFFPFSHRNIHRRSKAQTGTTNKECVRVLSFVYDGSKFTEVPVTLRHDGQLPGFAQSLGINNHGQIVGTILTTGDGFLATPTSGAD